MAHLEDKLLQVVNFHQQMPPQHPQHKMARNDLQIRPLGENKADLHRTGNQESEVGMDLPHFTKANTRLHQAVPSLDPQGKTVSGPTKTAEEYKRWRQGRWNDTSRAKECVQESSVMAGGGGCLQSYVARGIKSINER